MEGVGYFVWFGETFFHEYTYIFLKNIVQKQSLVEQQQKYYIKLYV
jgi:hypothetical protein